MFRADDMNTCMTTSLCAFAVHEDVTCAGFSNTVDRVARDIADKDITLENQHNNGLVPWTTALNESRSRVQLDTTQLDPCTDCLEQQQNSLPEFRSHCRKAKLRLRCCQRRLAIPAAILRASLTTEVINLDVFAIEIILTRLDLQAASVKSSSTMKILIFLSTIEIRARHSKCHRASYAIPTSNDAIPDPKDEKDRHDPQHLPKPTEVQSKGVPHSPTGTWGGVPRSSTTDRAAGSREDACNGC